MGTETEPIWLKLRLTEQVFRSLVRGGYYIEYDEVFVEHIEIVFGMTEHPKRVKVYELAWEYGHASGHEDVLSYYKDLVELVR